MLIPKITTYSTQIIPTMYQDGWRLISIYDDKMFWEKEEKKQVNRKELIETPEFTQFYLLYPKKKAPKEALKAWYRLTKQEQDKCLEVLPFHILYWKFKYWKEMRKGKEVIKDDTFIPYPASWLNGGEYKNEWLEVDWKSFDTLRKEKEILEKRRLEEIEKEKALEEERKESDETTLIIRRLKESWKYSILLAEAIKLCPPNAMQAMIDIRARWIVTADQKYWKSLIPPISWNQNNL